MLAIRLQRTGRKGHTQFRLIVQESQLNPSSSKVVAYLGSYNPHTKDATIDKEKAELYMSNGAQPSDSVARLFNFQKIKLPKWVVLETNQKRAIKNPDKLRKNRPEEPKEVPAEVVATEPSAETESVLAEEVEEVENVEVSNDPVVEESAPDEAKTEETTKDEPAEETKTEPEDK